MLISILSIYLRVDCKLRSHVTLKDSIDMSVSNKNEMS